ncbi:sulfatase [Actinoplanes sp. NPDC049316]|uniref:sulfatase n=1 Tax=Actinoplanes sp. NPDC049316 TaxID=3154727 RepID=UPI003437409B
MSRPRRAAGWIATGLAASVVFLALVVPDQVTRLPPGASPWATLLRVPLEALAVAAVLLALPARARVVTAGVLGALLGVLTVVKVVDVGFFAVLSRPFDPVLDWPLFADGYRFVEGSAGGAAAVGALVGAIALAVSVPVVMVLAVRRLAAVAARHRRPARVSVGVAAVAWLVLAVLGTSLVPGVYVASDSAVALARDSVLTVPAAIRDKRTFTAEVAADAFRGTAPEQLLGGLRGKDVVFAFIESYGRSAIEDPALDTTVRAALDTGTRQLRDAGYAARSGFLTSPTAGGGSWLAHSTFQSGVWIDNEQRYRSLVSGDRLTLTGAFKKAGAWQTVAVEPGVTYAWPEAQFYGYDKLYDSRTLGYHGPVFGWGPVPDQFALKSFTDAEYARPGRAPLMAELTFVSSHTPWAPLPSLVGWDELGDGSMYAAQHARGQSAAQVWKDPVRVRAAYAQSITYSIDSLVSWVRTYGTDDLVLVFLGDHQPAPVVVGDKAGRDVPVTVVAHDPAVLDRVASWGWTDGLRPEPQAPVWRMDQFRDKFLTTFAAATAPRPLSPPR